jgi:hypothetical protein
LHPDYIRTTIVYTHLNPWRAQLCNEPAEYPWSSHALYLTSQDSAQAESSIAADVALRFFGRDASPESAITQYRAHIDYQMCVDRYLAGDVSSRVIVAPSPCDVGDEYWALHYAEPAEVLESPKPRRPIYDVVTDLLFKIDPHCSVDCTRGGTRLPRIVNIRRQLIGALLAAGYRGIQIARFFGVSDTVVSKIAVSLRT